MPVDVSTTLSDLVTEDPRRTRILEKFELDYCCHGQRPLHEAVDAAGLDLAGVVAALDIADSVPTARGEQPAENAALAHDIVDTHHAYLWEEMPRLLALVDKVHNVHGGRHPELARVHGAFTQAVAALDPHMTTEERVVFPAISRLEKTQALGASGSLAQSIAQLRAEHDAVGDLFKEIRSLTSGYAAPDDACNSYRAMLAGLEDMELDLHEHIHKENNILFPRTLEMEQRSPATDASISSERRSVTARAARGRTPDTRTWTPGSDRHGGVSDSPPAWPPERCRCRAWACATAGCTGRRPGARGPSRASRATSTPPRSRATRRTRDRVPPEHLERLPVDDVDVTATPPRAGGSAGPGRPARA